MTYREEKLGFGTDLEEGRPVGIGKGPHEVVDADGSGGAVSVEELLNGEGLGDVAGSKTKTSSLRRSPGRQVDEAADEPFILVPTARRRLLFEGMDEGVAIP